MRERIVEFTPAKTKPILKNWRKEVVTYEPISLYNFDETSRKAIRAHGLIRVKLKDSLRDVFSRGEGCHNSSMPTWELEHKKSMRLWNQFGVEMVVEQYASQRMPWKWLIVMIPIEIGSLLRSPNRSRRKQMELIVIRIFHTRWKYELFRSLPFGQ